MKLNLKEIDLFKYKPYGIGLSLIVTAIIIATWVIVLTAISPLRQARHNALAIAKDNTSLVTYSDFATYYGDASYYVLRGKDEAEEEHLLLINQETNELQDFSVSDGISKKDAVKVAKKNGAKSTSSVVFGQVDGTAIWEVEDEGTLYLIDFQDGELVKKVG